MKSKTASKSSLSKRGYLGYTIGENDYRKLHPLPSKMVELRLTRKDAKNVARFFLVGRLEMLPEWDKTRLRILNKLKRQGVR